MPGASVISIVLISALGIIASSAFLAACQAPRFLKLFEETPFVHGFIHRRTLRTIILKAHLTLHDGVD